MRTITLLIGGALAFTSTVAMARDGERRFVHEGVTYIYTASVDHGRTVISGHRFPGGDDFRLVVDGKRVTGTSAGQPVSFRTAAARGAAGTLQIAAN